MKEMIVVPFETNGTTGAIRWPMARKICSQLFEQKANIEKLCKLILPSELHFIYFPLLCSFEKH